MLFFLKIKKIKKEFDMALKVIENENNSVVKCEICGAIVADNIDPNYWVENPNASDMWLEQLELHHNSHECVEEVIKEYTEEITCSDCGAVLAEVDKEYVVNNPNAYDKWVDQLLTEHSIECPENEDAQPYDEELFNFTTDFGKKGTIMCHHSYFASSGQVLEQENYSVKWNKGGVPSDDVYEILDRWSKALLQVGIKVHELEDLDTCQKHDLLASITTDFASAAEYELKKKGLLKESKKVVFGGSVFRLTVVPKRRYYEEEFEEITEEA